MASLSNLTTAFMKASHETTLTLANLNFNFALIKYDAPEEYHALGESLSSHRRKAAEDGAIHVAARKLTALFQSVIPPVPKLIHAYGLRVSEIAKLPTVNPKGTPKQGLFADHVGADGTSIWASATSGSEAVTMHLLACMLARIWKREEAIAIWTEFVQQRKLHLQSGITECDGPLKISDLAASHIVLTRTELDEWDASARYVAACNLMSPRFFLIVFAHHSDHGFRPPMRAKGSDRPNYVSSSTTSPYLFGRAVTFILPSWKPGQMP
jgi:hypothetical protein